MALGCFVLSTELTRFFLEVVEKSPTKQRFRRGRNGSVDVELYEENGFRTKKQSRALIFCFSTDIE